MGGKGSCSKRPRRRGILASWRQSATTDTLTSYTYGKLDWGRNVVIEALREAFNLLLLGGKSLWGSPKL